MSVSHEHCLSCITLVFIRHQARNIEVLGASSRCTGCYPVNLTGQGRFLPNFYKRLLIRLRILSDYSVPIQSRTDVELVLKIQGDV